MIKFRDEKILRRFTSCTKHPPEGHKIACKKMAVLLEQYFIKERIVKVCISLKGDKLACFAIG